MTRRYASDDVQPVPADECSHFRVLGYYFSLASVSDLITAYVHRVLGAFAVAHDPDEVRVPPTPNVPPQYRVVRAEDSADDRFDLLYGGEVILADVDATAVLNHLFWQINNEAIRQTGS